MKIVYQIDVYMDKIWGFIENQAAVLFHNHFIIIYLQVWGRENIPIHPKEFSWVMNILCQKHGWACLYPSKKLEFIE